MPENAKKASRIVNMSAEDDRDNHEEDSSDEAHDSGRQRSVVRDEETGTEEIILNTPSQTPRSSRKSSASYAGPRVPWNIPWIREILADFVEAIWKSEDLIYALKLTLAVFIVTWPALVPDWNQWYGDSHAIWAPLQLVFVFEVAIGTSFFAFILRAGGVTFGCVTAYLAATVGGGNLIVLMAIFILGVIPSTYVQLGTPYVKAGAIAIVSMAVVALASANAGEQANDNLVKRIGAFLVGGSIGLLVEVAIYPVEARIRMVEALSSSLTHILTMQGTMAQELDKPARASSNQQRQHSSAHAKFQRSKKKARIALSAAETFLPFCLREPQNKPGRAGVGGERDLEPIYRELIYVLHHIVDRMDNVASLRDAYGACFLEALQQHVVPQRRSVAACVGVTLFALNQALTARMPLPEYLPSSRLAQLRLVRRVREVVAAGDEVEGNLPGGKASSDSSSNLSPYATPQRESWIDVVLPQTVRPFGRSTITHFGFLSWNAAAAGQMEIIGYLEELIELVKLLVGVDAVSSAVADIDQTMQPCQEEKTQIPEGVAPGLPAMPARRRRGRQRGTDGTDERPSVSDDNDNTAVRGEEGQASQKAVAGKQVRVEVQNITKQPRDVHQHGETPPNTHTRYHDHNLDLLPPSLVHMRTRHDIGESSRVTRDGKGKRVARY